MIFRARSLADTWPELSGDPYSYGLRHLEPQPSPGIDLGHVCGTYSSGKGSKGSICAGVGVCADYELAGKCETLLREDLVADARAAIEKVGDALASGPLTDLLLQCGCNLIVGRDLVVEGHYYPLDGSHTLSDPISWKALMARTEVPSWDMA